ncbi:MAG TPA: type II secretion system protein GspM [Thermodesulfobacteriota bacterium]
MAITLARRERRLVVGGALVLALTLLYVLVVEPLVTRNRDLDRLIAQKTREYGEVVRLGEEYRQAQARLESLRARLSRAPQNFQLLSYLENLAVQNGIRDRIAYMRPQPPATTGSFREQSVEMRLDAVTINQTVRFLDQLASAPPGLRVKRLSMVRRYDDANRLDVVVQVAAYQLA